MSTPRQQLLELLTELSVSRRPITLSSGKQSDFYVDCKQTLLHPDGMALSGTVLVDTWQGLGLDIAGVGGPALGAVPMACAFMLKARQRGLMLRGFFIRRQVKEHGTQAWVEGAKSLEPGSRVLVLEDVITTGGSALRAIGRLRDAGFDVVALLALVDRDEGGREAIEGAGIPVHAVYHRSDFSGVGNGAR